MKRLLSALWILLALCLTVAGCSKPASSARSEPIRFADVGWDSIQFHNAVAMLIVEKAFGYSTEEVSATTPLTIQALKDGDMDIIMEMWTDNVTTYADDIKQGIYQELGVNFDDNIQGLYVPRYVIEGDPSRGIEASAPELKTVADLKNYKDVFVDEENPSKGRIYGAIPGWQVDEIMNKKYKFYGLDKDFIYFSPGSDPALAAAFTSAYEKGEPIVGYYWDPTWLTGKYDLVLLEDAPYDEALYQEGQCACPSVSVTVCVSNGMAKDAPEVIEFLKKYKTSSALTAEALAYLYDNKASQADTAKWFLKEHGDLLDAWLPTDKAEKVRSALQ